jgi:pimeloyl-ACP methyl ester carboxylesterase
MNSKLLVVLVLLSVSPIQQNAKADTIDFLFGAGSFGREASPIGDCRNIFQRLIENKKFLKDNSWRNRVVVERKKNFLSDVDFVDEIKYQDEKLGVVDSRFSKEFDTRIYYTSTAKPLADGSIPVVDKESKALVIYFHGSGTAKASGSNFAGKMNALAKLGYSAVSFDLPFHAEGTRNPLMTQTKEFADYVDALVRSIRVPGQPVILVGHSFGPDVMAEFITRHPHSADALVMLSPGGFDKVTTKWFADKTVNMTKTFGEVEANNDGGRWAGMVTNGRTWSNPKAPGRVDPTVANPKLKIYVVSGDREEYIPGELNSDGLPTTKPRDYDVASVFKSYFHNVDVTIEPGVGHYIFAHEDKDGQDVVLRSILRAGGESIKDEKAIKKKFSETVTRTTVDQFCNRYSKDIFFKAWLDEQTAAEGKSSKKLLEKLVAENDNKTATTMLKVYDELLRMRLEELNKHIKSTVDWAPEFYAANKEAVDTLGNKGVDGTRIQAKYYAFLKEQTEQKIAENALVDKQVIIQKELEIKKMMSEKNNRNPLTILATRLEKESQFQKFMEAKAQEQGMTTAQLMEKLTSTSDMKQALIYTKMYEEFLKKSDVK